MNYPSEVPRGSIPLVLPIAKHLPTSVTLPAFTQLPWWIKRKSTLLELLQNYILGFPGGTVVEGLPANAGDTGSSPGLGRSHMPRSN